MKKIILFTFFTFNVISLFSQTNLTLQYEACTNCQNNYPTYGNVSNMKSSDISSDFGRREGNSRWHAGLDVSPAGLDDDLGYHLKSLVSGKIVKIQRNGYKYIVIEDESPQRIPPPRHFAYGHIFEDTNSSNRVGDMYLTSLSHGSNTYSAIIYDPLKSSGRAPYCLTDAPLPPNNGPHSYSLNFSRPVGDGRGTIVFNHANQNIKNRVNAGDIIAPIGNSGGRRYSAHLHLYSLVDPGVTNLLGKGNTKDPLEYIIHDEPTYTPNISDVRNENNIYPNGPYFGKIDFKVEVDWNGTKVNNSNLKYSNAVLDLNDVEVQIRRSGQEDYELLQGAYFKSIISNGARVVAPYDIRYPSHDNPSGNVTGGDPARTSTNGPLYYGTGPGVDIAQKKTTNKYKAGFGDHEKTGIVGQSYGSNSTYNPKEVYFFNDYHTKIRVDDSLGRNNAKLARYNGEARYPDGNYNLRTLVRTVNLRETKSNPVDITIDNFKPYIEKVAVFTKPVFGPELKVYEGTWSWDPVEPISGLRFDANTNLISGLVNSLRIEIQASEPIINTSLTIQGFPVNLQTTSIDQKTYTYVVNSNQINFNGDIKLDIQANDFAGNTLLTPNSDFINEREIPIHQSNGTWSGAIPQGTDSRHSFKLQNSCTNPKAKNRKSSDCIDVDFSYNPNQNITVNQENQFTADVSGGTGELRYTWDFGDGSTSTFKNPKYTYNKTDVYSVTLTVTDATGDVAIVKEIPVYDNGNVSTTGLQLISDITQGLPPLTVQFGVRASKNITNYDWYFRKGDFSSDKETSTEKNPTVTYDEFGAYDVSLTVTYEDGTQEEITEHNYIKVDPPLPPFSIEIESACNNNDYINNVNPCTNDYAVGGMIHFTADDAFGSFGIPQTWEWDFGNGNTATTSGIVSTVNNSFSSGGEKTITVTCINKDGQTATATKEIYVRDPTPSIESNFIIANNVHTISSGPTTFTDNSITKNIAPESLLYYWDFGVGAYPKTANTKGPHSVCYENDATPDKKQVSLTVSADVNINGQNKTISNHYTNKDAVYVEANTSHFECGKGCEINIQDLSVDKINKQGTPAIYLSERPTLYIKMPASGCNLGWYIVDKNNNDNIVASRTYEPPGNGNPEGAQDCYYAARNVGDQWFCIQEGQGTGIPFYNYRQVKTLELAPYIRERVKSSGEKYPIELDLEIYIRDITNVNDGKKFRITTIIDNPSLDIPSDQNICLDTETELWPDKIQNPKEEYHWTAKDVSHLEYLSTINAPNPIFKSDKRGVYTYTLTVRNIETDYTYSKDIVINVDRPEYKDRVIYTTVNTSVDLTDSAFLVSSGFGSELRHSWSTINHLTIGQSGYASFNTDKPGTYSYTLAVSDDVCATKTTSKITVVVNTQNYCNSLNVYKGDFEVNNQSDVETINQYCEIKGMLFINMSSSLTELKGLNNIKIVRGDVFIVGDTDYNGLYDFQDALQSLETVGSLTIVDCKGFGKGFSSLRTVVGSFDFVRNNGLAVDMFDKLKFADEIGISDNEIDGDISLHSLSATSNLLIVRNKVGQINDFNKLATIGEIAIVDNIGLSNISGFKLIDKIEGNLIIKGNSTLNSIGIPSLRSVKGDFRIIENLSLTTLSGLGNSLSFIFGELSLFGNTSLTNACALSSILEEQRRVGSHVIDIRNNTEFTNSVNAIIDACDYQGCIYRGDLVLNSQAAIDNFRYCKIEGSLTISQGENSTIENLLGLSSLLEVTHDFKIIGNANLNSLSGLSNLNTIGGMLVITENDLGLSDGCYILHVLEDQGAIGGNITLDNNQGLIYDLPLIQNVCSGGDCMPSTTSTIYLRNQDDVDRFDYCEVESLIVDNEFGLPITNLRGLSSLKRIKNLEIRNCRSLRRQTIQLDNLELVENQLTIENNHSPYNSVSGAKWIMIPNLKFAKSISIQNNNVLEFIDIKSFENTQVENLILKGNKKLKDACGIANILNNNPSINTIIENNGTNTSNSVTIIDTCNNICIYNGDIVSSKQVNVQKFNYCEINGNLTIGGTAAASSDIIDITPLSSLKRISGDLIIQYNDNLTTLDGLRNLEFVGGQIRIVNNNKLTSLRDLSNINEIKKNLTILNNLNLSSISGFSGLSRIGGTFSIGGNNLENLHGLDNLYTIGGRFLLYQSNLSNLDGLSRLIFIGNAIQIIDNPLLNNVDGLTGITSISGSIGNLDIVNNPGLEQLNGLSNIISVNGNLDISNNTRLQNACGISQLIDNEGYSVKGTITIASNDVTTSLIQDILDNCADCKIYDNGNYLIDSQEDINTFEYCEITGNLTIEEAVPGNITDLSGLSKLETLGGGLYIKNNTSITDLDGLNKLTAINGSLELSKNAILANIDGLSSVETITGNMVIYGNKKITSLKAFNALTTLSGNLNLLGNEGLTNLDGFINLKQIGGFLEIKGHRNMSSFTGFGNLTTIGTDLRVIGNDLLNLNGLVNLKEVKGNLELTNNFKLSEIHVLSNIASIKELRVVNNNLTDLSGFSGLKDVGAIVLNNCDITNLDDLSNLTSLNNRLVLYNNKNLESISGVSNALNASVVLVAIGGNASLVSLSGLEKLERITAFLAIYDNPKLKNLDALRNVKSIVKTLQLTNNKSLTNACGILQLVANNTAVGGTTTIHTNSTNTSSAPDIIDFCGSKVSSRSIGVLNSDIDIKSGNKIRLYPNPVNNELHIESDQTILGISIYNYIGQTIYQKMNTSVNTFTISDIKYQSGIYFVKINTSKRSTVKKIVVE
ncbi:PKD domain-containing protein [Flavivirga eckloniae]|uniref:PKD domain-containing protein n=1 Tax=Flavivirga eckloniae TaxID=1803846 RepID=A0A2K9PLG5_9FLAO|nr:PKD domain-containing protein [Flavivirga eckloniae]AUP77919.1 hypothetical protein C1H87_04005 [Flavivirga eckloniae]